MGNVYIDIKIKINNMQNTSKINKGLIVAVLVLLGIIIWLITEKKKKDM